MLLVQGLISWVFIFQLQSDASTINIWYQLIRLTLCVSECPCSLKTHNMICVNGTKIQRMIRDSFQDPGLIRKQTCSVCSSGRFWQIYPLHIWWGIALIYSQCNLSVHDLSILNHQDGLLKGSIPHSTICTDRWEMLIVASATSLVVIDPCDMHVTFLCRHILRKSKF